MIFAAKKFGALAGPPPENARTGRAFRAHVSRSGNALTSLRSHDFPAALASPGNSRRNQIDAGATHDATPAKYFDSRLHEQSGSARITPAVTPTELIALARRVPTCRSRLFADFSHHRVAIGWRLAGGRHYHL